MNRKERRAFQHQWRKTSIGRDEEFQFTHDPIRVIERTRMINGLDAITRRGKEGKTGRIRNDGIPEAGTWGG